MFQVVSKRITISYDPITETIAIVENDFRTFEAIGLLQAATAMIEHDWLTTTEGERL